MGLSSKHVEIEFQWGTPELSKPLLHKPPEPLKCPRCTSANTKFCYYNNYNKSQPRHFCKSCKRHWTKGGTLRNVPVGGGRKNKRPKASKPAAPPHQNGKCSPGEKSMSSIIYEALLHEPSESPPQNSGSEFHFSGLSSLDTTVSWNAGSYHSLNGFDPYGSNLEEPTINVASSSSGPWPVPCSLDLPNYWNWSDIDAINSG